MERASRGQRPKPRRPTWLRLPDVLALGLAVAAGIVLLDLEASPTALQVIIGVLISWPLVIIGIQIARWSRQRDVRFVTVALLLTALAGGSVWISTLLTR